MLDGKELYEKTEQYMNQKIEISGWIKNHRKQKDFGFISFSDGTYFTPIQIVYDSKLENFEEIQKFHVGCAIEVKGTLVESPKDGQDFEVVADEINLLGDCPEDYPLQPKRHSNEFLREIAYLRPRTNLFQAVFRIRSIAAQGIHRYFSDRGYVYAHTPLLTANDGEGAGEMFQVTTLDLENLKQPIDYNKDFFNEKVGLTVTGQLEAEAFAMAFKKVYTFGPTFRAENSNTKTHASEFWMVEPEVAFCDLNQIMDIMEEMLQNVIQYVLDNCKAEYELLDKFVEPGLLDRLNKFVNSTAVRITHEEAITVLQQANQKFEFEPKQGEDLAREHEKYLTEHYDSPVFVYDWPKDIKAFYMKLNEDQKTVAAVDLLVPGSGELMGGSQREENADKLLERMKELDVPEEGLEWYINLRKFGGCNHSGFGMGFERLLMYITGVDNIRDVIPFPRTPGNCDY